MYQQLPLHKPHLSGPDSLKIPTLDPQVRFLLFSLCASLAADPTCILLATGTTPPTVAINERVRKSPPRTTSVETTTILKRPKTDSAGSRGRTRVSDFDDLTRSLADETISIYQAQITAVQPWPSTAENWESVSQGWVEVCTSRNVRIELDDEIFKAVRISFHFLLSIFHHSLLYFRLLTVPRKLEVMRKQSQNPMLSPPFPWIHQLPSARFATRLRSFSMRHAIFIRHVPSFSLFCTIPDLKSLE